VFLTVTGAGKESVLTATVGGDSRPATGPVLFLDGDQVLGIEGLVDGKASLRVPRGHHAHHFRVLYLGAGSYGFGQSQVLTLGPSHAA
jgi:hypothetical protein